MAIKIRMFNVGDADAILVELKHPEKSINLLVDGGKTKEQANGIISYLKENDIIPHILICSHLHRDHVGGLRHILLTYEDKIEQLWIHNPLNNHDRSFNESFARKKTQDIAFGRSNEGLDERVEKIYASVQDVDELWKLAQKIGIKVIEPFPETDNEDFRAICDEWNVKILGPSKGFYESLVPKLLEKYKQNLNDSLIDVAVYIKKCIEDPCSMIGQNGNDTPENESSLIFTITENENKYFFTGDAGLQAFNAIKDKLGKGKWFKVPHHGSEINLSCEIIDYIKPSKSFISASGVGGHPNSCIKECLGRYGYVDCTGEKGKDLIEEDTNG